jgi:hypothetical protein
MFDVITPDGAAVGSNVPARDRRLMTSERVRRGTMEVADGAR